MHCTKLCELWQLRKTARNKKKCIWFDADDLVDGCVQQLNWIELIDNKRKSYVIGLTGRHLFLPMNFDHYCSIIISNRNGFYFFVFRVRDARENVYIELEDNSTLLMTQYRCMYEVGCVVISRVVSGDHSELECCALALRIYVFLSSLIQFFVVVLLFLHAIEYRHAVWVCAVCGPNSTFTFNRWVECARARARAHTAHINKPDWPVNVDCRCIRDACTLTWTKQNKTKRRENKKWIISISTFTVRCCSQFYDSMRNVDCWSVIAQNSIMRKIA